MKPMKTHSPGTVSRTASPESLAEPNRKPSWLRRLGLAGFLFFLIKGLLWLAIPAALMAWRSLGQ